MRSFILTHVSNPAVSVRVMLCIFVLCGISFAVTAKEVFGMKQVKKSDAEWKKELTPEQYRVLREQGTERPFTGALLNEKRNGDYACAACGAVIFSSESKFESGTGWPSFFCPIKEDQVETKIDKKHGMERTEVVCPKCGGHLGHVFNDGPPPTYQRYCMNSVALKFIPEEEKK